MIVSPVTIEYSKKLMRNLNMACYRKHNLYSNLFQMPPPVVCWNIAPSMGQTYTCKEPELVPIPRYALRPREKIGGSHAGEVRHSTFISFLKSYNISHWKYKQFYSPF